MSSCRGWSSGTLRAPAGIVVVVVDVVDVVVVVGGGAVVVVVDGGIVALVVDVGLVVMVGGLVVDWGGGPKVLAFPAAVTSS